MLMMGTMRRGLAAVALQSVQQRMVHNPRERLYANPRLQRAGKARTLSEMRQLQDFVREYKETPGKSLNELAM